MAHPEYSIQKVHSKKSLWLMLVLLAIVWIGAALRTLYLKENLAGPNFSFPRSDAAYHDYWAKGIATGDWAPERISNDPEIRINPYFRPPGYPFFLAIIYFVFGHSYLAAIIVQMALGLVNCLLGYLLGKKLFGSVTGLIFAAFMSIYWVFIYFEGELLAPVIIVTLSLSFMYVLCFWCNRFTFVRAFAVGVLVGLFALTRPNILLFIPVVLGWSLWVAHRRKDGRNITLTWLGFILAVIATIAPATIRNYIVSGDFVLITSNSGVNLYIGNNEKTNGYTPGITMLAGIPGFEQWTSADYPKIVRFVEIIEGREMKHSEVSSYFTKKALDYIRENPGRTLKLLCIKAALFWGPAEVTNNKEISFEKQNSTILRYIPGFPMVVSLAVVGLIHLLSDLKKTNKFMPSITQNQFEISILILLFIAVYFVSFLPFFTAARYRVPIIPFLFLFGAYGLYRTGRLISSRSFYGAAVWVIVYLVIYGAVNQLLVQYKPDLSRWHFRRGYFYRMADKIDAAIEEYHKAIKANPHCYKTFYNLGNIFLAQDNKDEAASNYRMALQIKPDFVDARVNLGIVLSKQGKLDEAINHYRIALQFQPNNFSAYINMAYALDSQGKHIEASGCYRRALQIKPDFVSTQAHRAPPFSFKANTSTDIDKYRNALQNDPNSAIAHYNLANVLRSNGDTEGAINHYSQALRIKPDYVKAHCNLGVVLASQKKFDEAIKQYGQALAIEPNHINTRISIASALLACNKFNEAIGHYRYLQTLKPNWPVPIAQVARILVTHPDTTQRDIAKALVLAERAAGLTGYSNPMYLGLLASVYAADGQFDKAVTTAQKALYLSTQANNQKLANYIQEQLQLYKKKKP